MTWKEWWDLDGNYLYNRVILSKSAYNAGVESLQGRVRKLEGELKALRNELDSHLSEIYSRGSVSDG